MIRVFWVVLFIGDSLGKFALYNQETLSMEYRRDMWTDFQLFKQLLIEVSGVSQ